MAAIVGEERYVFETEWYDQIASIVRHYRITYYPTDKTIEMVIRSWHLLNPLLKYSLIPRTREYF